MQNLSKAARKTKSDAAFSFMYWTMHASLLAQIFIDPTIINISSAGIIWCSSALTIGYLQRSGAFFELPVSAFAVLGLCLTTQWGALTAQSAAWISVSENLWNPVRTFSWL